MVKDGYAAQQKTPAGGQPPPFKGSQPRPGEATLGNPLQNRPGAVARPTAPTPLAAVGSLLPAEPAGAARANARPRDRAGPGPAAPHLDDLDEAREDGVARHGDEGDVGEMLRDEQGRQRRHDRPGPASVRPAAAATVLAAAAAAAALQRVAPRQTAGAPLVPSRANAEGGGGRRRGAQRDRGSRGGGGRQEASPRGSQQRRPPAPAQP